MKNQWPIWVLVIGVVIIVLFAFNYHGQKDFIPLSEIFPDEKSETAPDIQYEFMNAATQGTQDLAAVPQESSQDLSVKTEAVMPKAPVASPAAPAPQGAPAALEPATPPAGTPVKTLYTIQVASSKNKAGAETTLNAVKAKGYPAFLAQKDLGQKGMWYRVYVGNFQTRKEAEAYLPKVRQDYKDSFIITPK